MIGIGLDLTLLRRRGGVSVPPLISDSFTGANGAALDPGIWTTRVGSWEINGNQARAKTIALDGVNLVTNGEFTTDTSGWLTQSGAVLTRRDFTTSPDIDPTGGTDEFGLEVEHGTATQGLARYESFSLVPGVNYTMSARAYSPSANTAVNAAMIFLSGGGAVSATATAEDVWQTLTCSLTPTAAANARCYCNGTTLGDKTYFDAVSVQAKTSLITCDPATADVDITVTFTMPASGTAPFGMIARYQDATHYWKWRLRPGTAGTDFELLSVNGTVTTVVATADVDWVASQQYTLRFQHYGTQFAASVDGVRTLRWSSSYLENETEFGLYDAAVANATIDDWHLSAAADTGVRGLGILGDSISTGPNEWPQKVVTALPNYVEFNHAGNGEDIKNNMVVQVGETTTEALDTIIIALGTNDTDTTVTQSTYLTQLQALQAAHPTARIICMYVLPKTNTMYRATVNAAISAAAASAGITDVWDTDVSAVAPFGPWIDPATDTSDGLHPNDAGHVKIAAEVVARLAA